MSVTEDFECEKIDIKQEAPDSDTEPGSSGSQPEKPFKYTVWARQDEGRRQHGQGHVILSDLPSPDNNQMKCEVKSECEEESGESVGNFSTEIPASVKVEAEDVERQDGCTETASGTGRYSRDSCYIQCNLTERTWSAMDLNVCLGAIGRTYAGLTL